MMRVFLIAVLGIALAGAAHAQPFVTLDRSGTITTGGTAQVLMPVNPSRHGCILQNLSANDLWISDLGTAAATPPSFKVPAGAQYTCVQNIAATANASTAALSIFGATTAQAFAAREW